MMPHATFEQPVGERRQDDRRKKDGLGLLPVATTPDEREYRARLNKLAGLFLAGFGAFSAGGSSDLLVAGSVQNAVLGMVMLGQGIYGVNPPNRTIGQDTSPQSADTLIAPRRSPDARTESQP